jgi:peptidoglycan/xylan/chitin deacetylase (PgdA/CDA1 family)
MLLYLAVIIAVVFTGALLSLVAYATLSLFQEYRRDRVPALLYHHFAPKEPNHDGAERTYDPVYFCYESAFDEQMNYLHERGYTTISLDDFIAFQDGRKTLPPKPIILTFDDGFVSNYLYAFPKLKKYGMTATIFVVLDRNAENFAKYASVDAPLTREQMKEMSDYGLSLESHSMTHRYLTELAPDDVRWELRESKTVLETVLDKQVQFLAIPTGAYNKRIKQQVKDAGYQAAFCMRKGTNNRRSDRYALRRLVVARDFTIDDFQRLLMPRTACSLRILSFLQDLLFNTFLGPSRCDALRNRLYRTRLASFFIHGQLKYLLASLAAVVFAIFLVSIVIIIRYIS